MSSSSLPERPLNAARLLKSLEATADVIVSMLDDYRLGLIRAGVPAAIVDELHAAAGLLRNRFAQAMPADSIEPAPAWLRSLIDGLHGDLP